MRRRLGRADARAREAPPSGETSSFARSHIELCRIEGGADAQVTRTLSRRSTYPRRRIATALLRHGPTSPRRAHLASVRGSRASTTPTRASRRLARAGGPSPSEAPASAFRSRRRVGGARCCRSCRWSPDPHARARSWIRELFGARPMRSARGVGGRPRRTVCDGRECTRSIERTVRTRRTRIALDGDAYRDRERFHSGERSIVTRAERIDGVERIRSARSGAALISARSSRRQGATARW